MSWKDKFPKENRYYENDNGILYCADCLDIMKQMPENSVDLLLTDPPYNVSRKNNFKTMKRYNKYKGIDFGEWDKGFNQEKWILNLENILNNNVNIIIFNSWQNLLTISNSLQQINVTVKRPLVLKKKNPIPSNRDRLFTNSFEFGVWGVKGKWTFNRENYGYKELYWEYSIGAKKYNHPTIKPLEFIIYLIETLSNKNNLVFDPFLGSGTTAVACEQLNRRWIGIEISEEYCEIAKKRIKSRGLLI